MIVYCDSSALVKLYVEEAGSAAVREVTGRAEAIATCRITWVELHAAMARRARETPQDIEPLESARNALTRDWPAYLVLEVTQALVERAGELADAFALRAFDSVQLAAAAILAESVDEVAFACFDTRLARAARLLGMPVVSR